MMTQNQNTTPNQTLQRTGCIKGQVIYQGLTLLENPKPGFGGGGGFIGLRIKKVD